MTPPKAGEGFDINRCIEHAEDIGKLIVLMQSRNSNVDQIQKDVKDILKIQYEMQASMKVRKEWRGWRMAVYSGFIIAALTVGLTILGNYLDQKIIQAVKAAVEAPQNSGE